MSYIPRPGDHVFHKPSRESWIVKYVNSDRLAWCGWPPGEARLVDCRVTLVLTDKQREDFLNEFPKLRQLNAA